MMMMDLIYDGFCWRKREETPRKIQVKNPVILTPYVFKGKEKRISCIRFQRLFCEKRLIYYTHTPEWEDKKKMMMRLFDLIINQMLPWF